VPVGRQEEMGEIEQKRPHFEEEKGVLSCFLFFFIC
jgi:hypothetical protein